MSEYRENFGGNPGREKRRRDQVAELRQKHYKRLRNYERELDKAENIFLTVNQANIDDDLNEPLKKCLGSVAVAKITVRTLILRYYDTANSEE